MSDEPDEDLYELRTTSTIRRALGEALPEAVAAAACPRRDVYRT